MSIRVYISLAAAVIFSTSPSAAWTSDARSFAVELAGKTFRFADKHRKGFGQGDLQAWFAYMRDDGVAFVWKPADNKTRQMNWRVRSSKSFRWHEGSRSHYQPLELCLVETPVSPRSDLDCRSLGSPPANKNATLDRKISICMSPADRGTVAFGLSCHSNASFEAGVTDSMTGDVLAIGSGQVPCRLCRRDASFDDVLRATGGTR